MRRIVSVIVCALLIGGGALRAQDDEEQPFRPGLIATYRDQQARPVVRIEPMVALDADDVPGDPRLAMGAQTVRWQGRLLTQGGGDYRLHVYALGAVKIELAGQLVLDARREQLGWLSTDVLKLEHDYHPLVISYSGTPEAQRIRLFWSSDAFALEPLPAKQLVHEPLAPAESDFMRGRELARVARCAACHAVPGEASQLPAPALDKLAGNLNADWLRWWLDTSIEKPAELGHRGRHFPQQNIDTQAAGQLTAWLLGAEEPPASQPLAGEAAKGQRLFETVGCLACHRVGERGAAANYSGSDLTSIADKRPAAFFARWLESPEKLNRDHRMPTFELSPSERGDLAAYLATLTSKTPPAPAQAKLAADAKQQGQKIAAQLGCANCHHLPDDVKPLARTAWSAETARRWKCQQAADGEQPLVRYDHTPQQRADLAAFVSAVAPLPPRVKQPVDGAQLLVERNCVGCHSRETSAGLAPRLLQLAQQQPDYAALVPALTPPSLLAVGDKLHDAVLTKMMRRSEQPHRDYLAVRMPRFAWEQTELDALVRYFVSYDRIPPDAPDVRRQPKPLPAAEELAKAGERLVTPAGFGCTSCHAIGNALPVKAPLNARGPNLSLIGQRTREPWFFRWCQNPARIVPQMEMPSVQVPVKGVLSDNIDQQLAAVWTILNKPGFEPKDAGPLRVVRRSGDPLLKEPPTVGTDVLIAGGKTYLAPLVVALPNRHNLLFDLESGRLARWWLGDAMEQRTKGKSWYWQTDGVDLLNSGFESPEITLVRAGSDPVPRRVGQFITELDDLLIQDDGVRLGYRLQYDDIAPSPGPRTLRVFQTFQMLKDKAEWSHAWHRKVVMHGLPKGSVARLRLLGSERMKQARLSPDGRTLTLGDDRGLVIALPEGAEGRIEADGSIVTPPSPGEELATPVMVRLIYRASETPEKTLTLARNTSITPGTELAVIPGLSAQRLAIDTSLMPTGLAWQRRSEFPAQGDPRIVVASLEGRIWSVEDTDGDGLEDHARAISDDLAAPYGIVARRDAIDVVTKTGLLRLQGTTDFPSDDNSDVLKRWTRLAAGWGHTDDYHDWTVGIAAASDHRYYLSLPCVQDRRSAEAARYRGQVLEVDFSPAKDQRGLPPEVSTAQIKTMSTGHRFPMGIARNKAGELFVTDNQGNYNPFNELNHVRPGRDFGFVNSTDKGQAKPPLTPPAVNLPHPWTRSVNGICFLETPDDVRQKLGRAAWGPFENQLIGCEYDTRRLIRISLQKVGETFQGACYPFSWEQPRGESLLGPICCAIAPSGDLYVGGIRDSGWGGGNNVGEIVRVNYPAQLAALPPGIAELQATATGFTIDFIQPVDARLGSDLKNYTLESYTRKSTPAYGGPDEQRRVEKIDSVTLSADRRRATLHLRELRVGFVYEFQLKNLSGAGRDFFPAQAFYTLNTVP